MRIPSRPAWAVAVILVASPVSAADCGPTSYDCALFHYGRREFADAVRHLEQRLAVEPRDLKALNLLGITLTASGKRDAGNERFRAALALAPDFHPARKNLAINEYDSGKLAQARLHLERVLKAAPADEVANLYLAEIHFQDKRPREALVHYEKSGARYAQAPLWTLHYGQALLEGGRTAEAVRVLDRLPPADGEALFEAGVALGRARAHAEAARFFSAARRTDKDRYAAGFNEALMRIEAGDHEGAIPLAQEMIAAGQARAELHNLVARAYAGAGRIQEAYDALRLAARLDPTAPENYMDLATLAVEHENFDLGLEIVDIGLRQLPDSWTLRVQRGVVLAMKGEMAEAETEFDEARRLAPDQAVPYAALGMAWLHTGQTEKAVDVLRAELPRREDHVVPYMFALALLRSGVEATAPEAAEALDALRASIRANASFPPSRAELGKLLLKRSELDAAIRELEKAVELDPGSTPALYALSQAHRRKGDLARAQELAAKVSRLNAGERGDDPDREMRRAVVRIVREGTSPAPPSTPAGNATPAPAAPRPDRGTLEARYGAATVLAKAGDLEGAIRRMREVVAAAPGLADARYDLGLHLWNRYRRETGLRDPGLLEEAERELRTAVQLDPASVRSRRALGQLLADRQRLDEAVEHLREAVRLAPGDPGHAYDLALALRMQGDLEGAEAYLRRAIGADPKHAGARRALGLVLRQKGLLPAAVAELRTAVAERPGDAQAHNVLGTVLIKLEDHAGAVAAFREAARLEPALTEAHVNLAQALSRTDREAEARAVLAQVRRLKEAEAAHSRAMLLLEVAAREVDRGETAAAVASLREAVSLAPDFAPTRYALALALDRASAPEPEVEEALLDAVRLDPSHARARYEWARRLARRGDQVAALDQLRQAVALQPSLVEAHRELARLAAQARDWPTAEASLEALLVWDVREPAVYEDLARVLDALGRGEEAARARDEARSASAAEKPSR